MNKSIYQSLSSTFFVFLLFSFASAHNKTQNDSPPSGAKSGYGGCFPKVFAFGESDTDAGNAPFVGSHVQGGLNFNVSAQVPARLVVDFMCQALSLPPPPPYKRPSSDSNSGVNFAISGSSSLSADFFGPKNLSSLFWSGVPVSFQTQIDWFNKYLNSVVKGKAGNGSRGADVADALFWIGQMGVSDYASAISSSVSLHSLAESSVKHVSELLTTLVSSGAKYVIVQGLPPVGCFPLYMSSSQRHNLDHAGCVATVNAAIMAHNQILQWALDNFRKTHPQCSILYADYWNAYMAIATNPKKYGMEEPFKACCGFSDGLFNFNKNKLCGSSGASVCKDPSKYINWDGVHLTEAMHKHLADLFLHQGFCHPSFDELVKKKKSM